MVGDGRTESEQLAGVVNQAQQLGVESPASAAKNSCPSGLRSGRSGTSDNAGQKKPSRQRARRGAKQKPHSTATPVGRKFDRTRSRN